MQESGHRTYNGHRIATVFHDAGGDAVVVYCHGFRGTKVGPRRLFVALARELAAAGVSSLRFDQFGSGDSDGAFEEASFDDWVETTREIVREELEAGSQVALLGQSMGGSAALVVASQEPRLAAVGAWVPDPVTERPTGEPSALVEEDGERVRWRYWHEAHSADVLGRFAEIAVPSYVVLASADHFVSEEEQQAFLALADGQRRVERFPGYSHSGWTDEQARLVVERTRDFLLAHVRPRPRPSVERKRFADSERVRRFLEGSRRDELPLGAARVGRGVYRPGWRWSEHVRPLTGEESAAHVGYVLSGRMAVRGADGVEVIVEAGEAFYAAPGHDAWVVGDEQCVALDFELG